MTATYTADQITAIGGNEWTSRDGSKHRVYLNNWAAIYGLETTRYNTGNICGATLDGESISNNKAKKLLGSVEAVYWDSTDGRIHIRHYDRRDGINLDALRVEIADAVAATELTTRQAAKQLGVSIRTVQRRCQTGKLTARKSNGRWIITL